MVLERNRSGPLDPAVDATGRTGRTPAWLKELRYDPPAEEHIRVDIAYASWYLRPRPAALAEEKLIVIGADPNRRPPWRLPRRRTPAGS